METKNGPEGQPQEQPPAPAPAPQRKSTLFRLGKALLVATGVLLVLVALAAIIGPHFLKTCRLPPQPPAVGNLRTINTAEVTYSSTYTLGFSPNLAALGGFDNCEVSNANRACLIDTELASGEKSGYQFVYISHAGASFKGLPTVDGYSIQANPIKPGTGNYYYTDQSGVIRMNNTRPATEHDNPLGG